MILLGNVDWQLGCKVLGIATVLAFCVVGIPLGVRESSINNVAFVAYNVVYCWYGFVLLRLLFEYVLPGLSKHLYVLMFWATSGSVILFYMLYFMYAMNMSIGLVRTVPPSVSTVIVMAAYLLHALHGGPEAITTSTDNAKSDLSDSLTVATTTSPMRIAFDIDKKMLLSEPVIVPEKASYDPTPLYDAIQEEWLGLTARSSDMEGVQVLGPRVHQWARCVALSLTISATYLYCQWLSFKFSSTKGALGEVGLYFVFVLSFSLLRPFGRYVGYQLDQYKTGGPSVEMLMEIGISCFYFIFYRSLFVSVKSYSVFFAMKGIHVAHEVANFTLCFSPWYREFLGRVFLDWKDFPLRRKVVRIVAGCKSVDIFVQLQCIKTGMRLYLFLFSAISFMLFFTFLRFGYNRSYYCMYQQMDHGEYTMLMTITSLSVLIELGVYMGTDWMCKSTYGHGVLAPWEALLHGELGGSHRAIIIYMIWLLAHVTTDIYLAKVDVSSIGGIDCPDSV